LGIKIIPDEIAGAPSGSWLIYIILYAVPPLGTEMFIGSVLINVPGVPWGSGLGTS